MTTKGAVSQQSSIEFGIGGRPTVLVVSDVRLLREGIALLVADDARLRLLGVVGVEEAVSRLRCDAADVVLLDAAVVASAPVIGRIREAAPAAKLVAFGLSEEDDDLLACAHSGITGFVFRDGSVQDLVAAVDDSWRGTFAASPRLTALLLARMTELGRSGGGALPVALTRREQEIAPLLAGGLSNKEIARQLGLEVATVKNYVHNILNKLQLHRRAQLAGRLRLGRL